MTRNATQLGNITPEVLKLTNGKNVLCTNNAGMAMSHSANVSVTSTLAKLFTLLPTGLTTAQHAKVIGFKIYPTVPVIYSSSRATLTKSSTAQANYGGWCPANQWTQVDNWNKNTVVVKGSTATATVAIVGILSIDDESIF